MERVEQLEDGALVGGRELFDLAQALEEPGGAGRGGVLHWFEAQ